MAAAVSTPGLETPQPLRAMGWRPPGLLVQLSGSGACSMLGLLQPGPKAARAVPCRRTVQDKKTGADIKLTDEQIDLVQRLQKGHFGDVHFNPYEVGPWRCSCPRHGAGPGWAGAAAAPWVCVLPSPPLTSSRTR